MRRRRERSPVGVLAMRRVHLCAEQLVEELRGLVRTAAAGVTTGAADLLADADTLAQKVRRRAKEWQ